jgi:hypothetical protein
MTATDPEGHARAEPGLLGVYLNDHLAGATGGVDLVRRTAKAHEGTERGETLERLAEEIEEDKAALETLMSRLGVSKQRYKTVLAAVGEKLGRVKANGYALRRSPLSGLMELEAMSLGVEGKAALWKTLRTRTDDDPRLDPDELDRLLDRARGQLATLEELRMQTAAEVLAS